MQNPDSQEVVNRFFEALDRLKADKVIRGKQTFTDRYGINRWNMLTLQKEPHRDIFQAGWLTYLTRDYGVSPLWLLTGEGEFYSKKPVRKEKPEAEKKKRGRKPKEASEEA